MKQHIIFNAAMLAAAFFGQAQILPKETLPAAVPAVTDSLRQTAKQLEQRALQQRALQQQLAAELAEKAALPDPLTVLPATLDVLNLTGQLQWREVEVEQGFRAIEREWLLLVSVSEWQQLIARWPQLSSLVQSEDKLDSLGLLMVNIKVPAELDSAAALTKQLDTELTTLAGRNHIYQPQTAVASEQVAVTELTAMCALPVTLGMVDTAIALEHPALRQQPGHLTIQQHNFLPDDMAQSYGHGTAIAGVLAGQHHGSPLVPQLSLYSAGAFYPSNLYQQSATLSHIVKALNWLVSQQVTVINMSLTGPDNPVLATVVRQLANQQIVLVAAAGNGGPAAAPLFPAAYDDVVAVTAVDQQHDLYRWANQGDYIEFAAPGVKIAALKADGGEAMQSGTSLAAPVVSAAIACMRAKQPAITLKQIRQTLIAQARDLGGQGKDPQFGFGLISAPLKAELQQ